jgi:hypothetical protein
MLMKRVAQRKAMITSVVAAFFASGGLNAGTPFETASTPVMAVHPFANARRMRNVLRVATPLGVADPAADTGMAPPVRTRKAPTAMSVARQARKK